MVFLSVSISASRSPSLSFSPTFFSQRCTVPMVMVGESADRHTHTHSTEVEYTCTQLHSQMHRDTPSSCCNYPQQARMHSAGHTHSGKNDTHTHTHTHTHTRTRTHTHTPLSGICTIENTHTHTHTQTYARTHTHTPVRVICTI